MKRKHADSEKRLKPKQLNDGERLKAKTRKKSKTLKTLKSQDDEVIEKVSEKKSKKGAKQAKKKSGEVEDRSLTKDTTLTKSGKKKHPLPVAEAAVPQDADTEAEQQRRALQRETQQLVIRLRSEGKTPAEIKSATKELKAKSEWTKSKVPKVKKQKQKAWEETAEKKRQEHLQKQHDLVIIPVVWRGRHDKLDVIKAAEDIKACLSQQGLDVWLDSRRHLTPGQKFAHWEHRGVLLRIEIGPDDLKAGNCQVCLAHTPGDYKTVERKRVSLPPRGTRSLLLRLKEWGLNQLEIDRRAGDSEEEALTEAPDKKQKVEVTSLDDLQGNWSPREEKAKGKAGKKRKKKV